MSLRRLAPLLASVALLGACGPVDASCHDDSGCAEDDHGSTSETLDGDTSGTGTESETGSAADERVAAVLELEGDPLAGESVFAAVCGVDTCHGPDGDSGPAYDMTYHVPLHSDLYFVNKMVKGGVNMPALDELSEQELADVLAYMLDRWG